MNARGREGFAPANRPAEARPWVWFNGLSSTRRRADVHIGTAAWPHAISVQPLDTAQVQDALAVTARRPYAHCYLTSMLERGAIDDLVAVMDAGELRAVASVAGNCVSTDLEAETAQALADHLAADYRRVASIVCRKPDVTLLWEALDGRWGRPREVRLEQPLLVLAADPLIEADPSVRRGEASDFATLLPACVEMFTGEVGVSPIANGMESAYRKRIEQTLASGRSFLRIDGDDIVFKAEIGAISSAACQVQGVWVRPDLRGRGLAAPAMAAVAAQAMATIAPAVELYVNDFNLAARKTYERAGFEQVDTFRTVFF